MLLEANMFFKEVSLSLSLCQCIQESSAQAGGFLKPEALKFLKMKTTNKTQLSVVSATHYEILLLNLVLSLTCFP